MFITLLNKKRLAFLIVALAVSSLSSCTRGTRPEPTPPRPTRPKPGSVHSDDASSQPAGELLESAFKLYNAPSVQPSPHCDYYAHLTLAEGPAGLRATLENRLDGICEMAVFPQKRTYLLARLDDDCGSRRYASTEVHYQGDSEAPAETPSPFTKVEIIDHRTRLCRNRVLARVIVKETLATGQVVTRYSHDVRPVRENDGRDDG